MTSPRDRWTSSELDRRAGARVEYRRTAPALLELEGCRCAVRDLGLGGLRIEPAPAGRVWHLGEPVTGTLLLRGGERIALGALIARLDRSGLALVPDGDQWPTVIHVESERLAVQQRSRERRSAPRLSISPSVASSSGTVTALRDVSATGLRYQLTRFESAPAVGSRIGGALRVDADTVIEVRGRVARHVGREVAIVFDPPGLEQAVLEMLHQRFLPR
jgi:PilZ domain-containing protein